MTCLRCCAMLRKVSSLRLFDCGSHGAELAPGELIMAPGVTCESLMNAIEVRHECPRARLSVQIGDPRMDMGVITDAQRSQPAFERTRLLILTVTRTSMLLYSRVVARRWRLRPAFGATTKRPVLR